MRSVTGRISDETELIQVYFAPLAAPGGFGLKDDCALIDVAPGHDIVVSTDPIIAGVHFFADDAAADIAWKALAVNVSDLIAKGADPIAYTMALAFPEAPLKTWAQDFSDGMRAAQTAFGCALIGGDTDRTPGPLSISITAFGQVPRGGFIQRNAATVGDHVFVTGSIGDAALGLLARREESVVSALLTASERQGLLRRYLRPAPCLEAVPLIRRFASAALDVSDGLVQDATRLARGAGAGLCLRSETLPFSSAARKIIAAAPQHLKTLVAGGDDYEILFSAAPENRLPIRAMAERDGIAVTEIGVLDGSGCVTVLAANGAPLAIHSGGYDHFRGTQ
ncbi:MAG: thiamine-phosphate kinase [Hyphomicrobium sp.]|nr:thiamine-phosphate kinase [Hyphomicrobium sp.]